VEGGTEADGGLSPFKGLASFNGCTDISVLNLSWYYNWTAATNCPSSAVFVPQIWGHSGENIAGEVKAAASSAYPAILGFNEPDNTTQSNISVAAAIALWPQLTSNTALRVGSPATQANTTGQAWFTSFMDQVNADTTGTLRVDFIAIHWYGWNAGSCEPTAATLESYIKWAEAIPGNRPIWLTEWACSNLSDPTAQTVQSFLSGAIAMFAKHPRLVRYGWFTSRSNDNNGLVTSAGALTALGTIYANAPSER
jgi:Glycosyl hydrolase catalytic core